MSKRRVWEVARDLKISSTRLVEDLCNQGIEVTNHFSMLDEETVELVLNLYREQDTAVTSVPPPVAQTATITALESAQPIAAPAQLPTQPTTTGKILRLPETFTIKDFAEALQVTVEDVLAQLMRMGTVASMNQVIDLDMANVVAHKLGKHVTLVTESKADVATDQIAGGFMSFPEEPNDTTSDLPGRRSEASDTDAQERGENVPSDALLPVAEGSGVSVYDTPTDTAEGSSASVPSAPAEGSSPHGPNGTEAEDGQKLVVIDLGGVGRQQIKRLRQGRGRLMRKVGRVFTALKAEDAVPQDATTLIMVVERRRRR